MSYQAGYDYFTSVGWSPAQSAGILGNLGYESGGLNPRAIGDGGKAYGLAQWHPDRQQNFQNVMGFPIQRSTTMDQFKFVNWELNNTEKRAGTILRQQSTVYDATKAFMTEYERPANMSSLIKRVNLGEGLLAGGKNLLEKAYDKTTTAIRGSLDTIENVAGTAVFKGMDTVVPGSGTILKNAGQSLGLGGVFGGKSWLDNLKDWIIGSGFFQRLTLAILAFIILFAALYLMKDNMIEKVTEKLK